jgi:hypothetical protein
MLVGKSAKRQNTLSLLAWWPPLLCLLQLLQICRAPLFSLGATAKTGLLLAHYPPITPLLLPKNPQTPARWVLDLHIHANTQLDRGPKMKGLALTNDRLVHDTEENHSAGHLATLGLPT